MRRTAQLGLLAALLAAGAAEAAGPARKAEAADAAAVAQKADPVVLAQQRYRAAKEQGLDLSPGPCLGELKPGWVADVAHSPRQPVDDLPENQCAAYRSGQARHFVELDPEGNLIRSR